MSKKRVAVAMSGGVDSSVAAALLIEQGYDVVGVTMRMWPLIDAETETVESESERDARAVADRLGIEHYVLDVRDEFSSCIVNYFVNDYRCGRTPNPCVKCNPTIKFGRFLEFAKQELGSDCMATGHYARIAKDEISEKYQLLRGADRHKDQSYVLYYLNQAQLCDILLPLGYYSKEEVRRQAAKLHLEVSDKSDSQDICFIPDGKYQDFLKNSFPDMINPGLIVDTTGKVLGEHQGIAFHTVGQRRGLNIASGKRLYVISIDAPSNTVVVGEASDLVRKEVAIKDINLISGEKLAGIVVVSAKIRYNTQDSQATLIPISDDIIKIVFDEEQRAVTPGQSAVFYKEDVLLGGGVIVDEAEARRILNDSIPSVNGVQEVKI